MERGALSSNVDVATDSDGFTIAENAVVTKPRTTLTGAVYIATTATLSKTTVHETFIAVIARPAVSILLTDSRLRIN